MNKHKLLWNHRCIYTLSWKRFEKLTAHIYKQLITSNFKPDIIVAIAKGGLIPGVKLSYLLNSSDFGIISIKRNTSEAYFSPRELPKLLWKQFPIENFSSALLIDDIIGSGETLNFAKLIISQQSSCTIKTASMVVNKNGALYPDFFGCEVDDWVIFPWESVPSLEDNVYNLPFSQL